MKSDRAADPYCPRCSSSRACARHRKEYRDDQRLRDYPAIQSWRGLLGFAVLVLGIAAVVWWTR